MEYNYLGRITSRRSLVTVHVFKPSVQGRGKPVIALRSCIYIDGQRLTNLSQSGNSLLYGRFEVLQVLKTKQKWDFACIMKNVDSSPLDCVEVLRRSCLSHRGVYHGVLVDYDHSASLYKLAVGPKVLTLPAAGIKVYNSVRPEILPDSFVCMRFQVLQLSTGVSEDLTLENIYLKISPADSCVMALLTSTPAEHTNQVVGSPSRTESEGVTARRTSVTDLTKMLSQLGASQSPPRIETPQLSNRLLEPGSSAREFPTEDEYSPLDQLTERDFFHLSPILSQRQIMEDRMRVTVTI